MQKISQFAHYSGQAAGTMQVIHEKSAGRFEIDDHRSRLRDFVEKTQGKRNTETSGNCDEVNDCIGGSSDCIEYADRIMKSILGHDLAGPEPFAHHFDNAPSRNLSSHSSPRMIRRDAACA